MLRALGVSTLDALVGETVPAAIRFAARWTCPRR